MNHQDLIKGQATEVSPRLALGALNNRWAMAKAADFANDVEVLNFALTLEFLEAEFYRQGNKAVQLSGIEEKFLKQIQSDEESHVKTLVDTIKKLGGTPAEAPKVDFGEAFENRKNFLTTSRTFENVGVNAYLGAAGFIKDKGILQAAAGIFGVEARHAAIIGLLLGLPAKGGVFVGDVETAKSKDEVLAAVAPFLAGGAGAGGTERVIIPAGAPDTGAGGEAKDTTGLVQATTGGVLVSGAAVALIARHRMAPRGEEDDD